ncbi:MAG TPA: ATP-grasp domain-containing protein [Pseudobacteroides sp.]|uniref:ATP-grasp domain-containing protein n=1 Tax=Pseudobacteroides sp. TaxID=1968840 RepID=UPI002F936300
MNKKRIWFNNWFNTAYHIINLIKQNSEIEFEVFGTNRNPNSVIFKACDYYEIERMIPEDEYVDFCLDFCKKHQIDIFAPRTNILTITQSSQRFEEIGVKLLTCCDSQNTKLLSDKALFYDHLRQNTDLISNPSHRLDGKSLFNIPKYYVVNNAQDFEKAYTSISNEGFKVCFKPVHSEGGAGFRIIDESAGSIDSLFSFASLRVTLDDVLNRLSQRDTFKSLMVMEFIDGYEYSVDCLALEGKLLAAVPRKKLDGRARLLQDSPELRYIASELTRVFNLSYAFNVQVRYDSDCPKILEINPRMSGGVWISCLSGINMPYLAVKLLLDRDPDIMMPEPKLDILVSQIEKEVLL